MSHGPRKKFQENLIGFLNTELDLGTTFCSSAQLHLKSGSTENYEQSLENANKALQAIRRFEERIADDVKRQEIHQRADELENLIAATSELLT